ncbi:MAG: hypothetical protein R3275_05915 [Saprospiraceae bacterium]|nr:hypothetical protein [Saprospiraceae bacterium]
MSTVRIFMILGIFGLISCGGDKKNPDLPPMDPNTTTQIQQQPMNNNTAQTPPPSTQEAAQNADGVWHYICPEGCEGGAGAAGPCPNCGAQLVHNSAFHAAANTQVQGQQNIQNPQLQQTAPPQTQAPAQNAQGEYHYVCPKGCAGGAAGAGVCSVCGAQLQHNTAYHQ